MVAVEERRKAWNAIPKILLSSKHLAGASLVESRLSMLDKLPKGMRILELGVAEGGFSVEMWKRLEPSSLTMVDMWEGDRYSSGYETVKGKFSEYIQLGKVFLHKSSSIEFLKECNEDSFDFIYIDTDHTYGTTLQELRQCARIVNKGFIAGHDYTVGNIITPMIYGVMQAVNQFCVENDYMFTYLTVEPAGWNSFCLKKI